VSAPHDGLAGKVALVTGAGSGIGRAAALAFAGAHAKVVVADINAGSAAETVELVTKVGGSAIGVECDVTSESCVAAMVERAINEWERLDIAHNNAGIAAGLDSTVATSKENWDRVIATNLTGAWLCMKHEIPVMQRGGGGSIVNTSSAAGLMGFPNRAAYVASKHGLIGLTHAAAVENASTGVRVNAVCPWVVGTPLVNDRVAQGLLDMADLAASTPIGRVATLEEVCAAVLWLASSDASYITGVALPVDGALAAAPFGARLP
jgi:NAD(P)-dependent dehydrogenase (short-subunit alcohol dehydrogenase family)